MECDLVWEMTGDDDEVIKSGTVRASIPSGASTGATEAKELRDGDKARFKGMGCLRAAENIGSVLAEVVIGLDPRDQAAIDCALIQVAPGDKSKIGANAVCAVSCAALKAGAAAKEKELYLHVNELAQSVLGKDVQMSLPVPCLNVINGGVHADNLLAFQEFFLIPLGASSFHEALRIGAETYQELKLLIRGKGLSTGVGDEGGFAPDGISSPAEAMALLNEAIQRAGHSQLIFIGSDPAASEFYQDGHYNLFFKSKKEEDKDKSKTKAEMLELYVELVKEFPNIVLLEDPFDEDDFDLHAKLTQRLGAEIEVVGDDLYTTNVERVQKGVDLMATNAMLLKVNQIGTISESLEAWKMCRDNGWGVFVSHRSGETEDTWLADLTVGIGAGHLKTGAPCRGERLAKYNRLLRIEEGDPSLPFCGKAFRTPWASK